MHELGQNDSKQLCERVANGSSCTGNISSWDKLCHNSKKIHNLALADVYAFLWLKTVKCFGIFLDCLSDLAKADIPRA